MPSPSPTPSPTPPLTRRRAARRLLSSEEEDTFLTPNAESTNRTPSQETATPSTAMRRQSLYPEVHVVQGGSPNTFASSLASAQVSPEFGRQPPSLAPTQERLATDNQETEAHSASIQPMPTQAENNTFETTALNARTLIAASTSTDAQPNNTARVGRPRRRETRTPTGEQQRLIDGLNNVTTLVQLEDIMPQTSAFLCRCAKTSQQGGEQRRGRVNNNRPTDKVQEAKRIQSLYRKNRKRAVQQVLTGSNITCTVMFEFYSVFTELCRLCQS